MLRECTRNGTTLLLKCWVKHWHVNYSKYVGKTRWKWRGHVGVRNYLSYKRHKARAISFLSALSPSFETNLSAFIKRSTVKHNRRPHNQGQNSDTCKTVLLVCECSLIKIKCRPIIFACTFNSVTLDVLIKLGYFESKFFGLIQQTSKCQKLTLWLRADL